MIRHALFAAGLTLLGMDVASAESLDGLFLQMKFAFGRLEESHYFFTQSGRYMANVPDGTLDVAGMDRACAQPRTVCGTYQVTRSQLMLAPAKGRPETHPFERSADGNLKIDGLFAKHVDQFAPGTKLEGQYSRSAGAGAVSAASKFMFKADGTFAMTSLGAVTTQQGVGKSEDAAKGTYRLVGNTLELSSGGNTKRVVAYPYDLGKGDVRLNIDGVFYKKQ